MSTSQRGTTLALLTKRPDGSWLVETRLDFFLDKWKVAALHDRLVLDDKRPAVRTQDDQGVSLTTIHPEAWDRVRAVIQPLLKQGQLVHPNKKRLCELCGSELKVVRELYDTWVFRCPSCNTSELHGKAFVGGQIGAGEREKQ